MQDFCSSPLTPQSPPPLCDISSPSSEPERQHLDPLLPCQSHDYGLRLPQGWNQNVKLADRNWIGHSLFVAKGKMTPNLKMWWHPPPIQLSSAKPSPESYHRKRLFLWMPRKMWKVDFRCPQCQSSLKSKGLYNHIRMVMDIKDFYYLAAEYMECGGAECNGTYIAWDSRMLEQLADGVRTHFPAVLTRKLACDKAIVTLLRSRTMGMNKNRILIIIIFIFFIFLLSGNSSTALRNNIHEVHSEYWLKCQLTYLTDCERHMRCLMELSQPVPEYAEVTPFPPFPQAG